MGSCREEPYDTPYAECDAVRRSEGRFRGVGRVRSRRTLGGDGLCMYSWQVVVVVVVEVEVVVEKQPCLTLKGRSFGVVPFKGAGQGTKAAAWCGVDCVFWCLKAESRDQSSNSVLWAIIDAFRRQFLISSNFYY